jgi:PhnB protein
MRTAHPYLHFNGNCEDAFRFYQNIFGGDLDITRFKDAPSDNRFPDYESEKILNVSLSLSDQSLLMGSDIPDAFPQAIRGTNFFISLYVDSQPDADLIFAGLSQNGQVAMPLAKTFWNAYFGMAIDQFGVQWMISFDLKS